MKKGCLAQGRIRVKPGAGAEQGEGMGQLLSLPHPMHLPLSALLQKLPLRGTCSASIAACLP